MQLYDAMWLGMPAYGVCVMLAVLLGVMQFVSRARRANLSVRTALFSSALAMLLGFLGARLYVILAQGAFSGVFAFVLLARYPFQYAVCGAVIGVTAGCALAAKATGGSAGSVLDCAAPAGLAALALCRFGEVFSDFGWGQVMRGEAFCFFPAAVADMYGQWHGCVFFLEAVLTIAAMEGCLLVNDKTPGKRFSAALTLWSLGQILCESLRAETLRWGFVRVQQIQCAVFALLVLAYWARGMSKKRLAAHLAAFFACVGVVVLMEYALDKWTLAHAVDYAVMAAALAGMGVCVFSPMRNGGAAPRRAKQQE